MINVHYKCADPRFCDSKFILSCENKAINWFNVASNSQNNPTSQEELTIRSQHELSQDLTRTYPMLFLRYYS